MSAGRVESAVALAAEARLVGPIEGIMSRVLALLVLVLPASMWGGVPAGNFPATLVLNSSSTDPWAPSVGDPFTGEADLYLWLAIFPTKRLTFGLTGTFELLDVIPEPGWTNVGTVQSPQLVASSDCAYASPIAVVRVRDASGAGARLCLEASALDGMLCFDQCTSSWYETDWEIGYRTDGAVECAIPPYTGCLSTPVDAGRSWGMTKATYR